MELKNYQAAVLDDLSRFLTLVGTTGNIAKAYSELWTEKNVPVGSGGMDPYHMTIPGVPDVCLKVPTGGGKTFIAASAIKPIFEALPHTKTRAVVWLVPSDAILEQTQKNLGNPDHPYRQRINLDFGHSVTVYSKEQLLMGQNFNPGAVQEQLSIFVLSYDSFRTNKKEGRKAYQQNGYLAKFAQYFHDPSILLADTDETALIQVIRYLNPVVIVDESHHAVSELSVKMLRDFNPSFVLDLTATPKKSSNIISFVDAVQLKKENMVKLPVIVYNRKTQEDVFNEAVNAQRKLETQAKLERAQTGRYIRPIVLLQAQPRSSEDSTTFEKVKRALMEIGIPEAQIAIKTASRNELKDINLMSETCPIRYIITVNALKEGWDCPFAYVLATIANKSSAVDVEQILGRILRLPGAAKNQSNVLNIAYVITSSADFQQTLQKVIDGLNSAGFSEKDCRAEDVSEAPPASPAPAPVQMEISDTEEAFPAIDTAAIRARLEAQAEALTTADIESDELFAAALQQAETYDAGIAQMEESDINKAPQEVRSKMNLFHLSEQFAEEARAIRLPQFFMKIEPAGIWGDDELLLSKEDLSKGFSLRGKDTDIDFTVLEAELARVDLDEGAKDSIPRAWKLEGFENEFFKEWFDSRSPEQRVKYCKDAILKQLNKNDALYGRELSEYVDRVISGLSTEQIEDLQQSPYRYGDKIKKKIDALMADHAQKNFELWIEQGRILCQPSYAFKSTISPAKFTSMLPKSLYTAEESMNGLEKDVVWELANLPNIKWWHRNMAKSGFGINGYVNTYPDVIAMTASGKILMIEPKGDHLENTESRQKVAVGRAWERRAGDMYRYYMVFRYKDLKIDGAVQFDRFIEIVKGL